MRDRADLHLVAARRAVSAVFFVDGALLGGWAPYLATAKAHLGISDGVLGTALLASALGAVSTMPFAGALIHRFGSRTTALFGGLLLALIVPWLIVAPSLPLFALLLYVYGASNGQMDVGMNSHAMAVQDRYPRPILSAVHGWFSVGGFAGGAGMALASAVGLPPVVHLAAASAVLAVVLVVAARFLLPADVDRNAEGPKFAWPKGVLLAIGVLVTLAFVGEGGAWDWAAIYLRNSLHTPQALAGLGFGLFSFAMASCRFVGDGFIHRFGHRRVLGASGCLAGLGFLCAVSLPSPWLSIAGFAVVGLGLANAVPILFKAAGSVPGFAVGPSLAAVTTCGYSGFLVGPPVVGAIADWRSLAFSLALIGLLCLVVGIAGPLALRRTRLDADVS